MLSNAELEVLYCLTKGYTNEKIAKETFMSLSLVKRLVSQIICKLHARNRVEAVFIAASKGLIK